MTQQDDGSGVARYLVLFEEDAADEGSRAMTNVAGIRAVHSGEIAAQTGDGLAQVPGGVLWPDLGVAVVTAATDQINALRGALSTRGPIAMIEREQLVYAISTPASQPMPASSEEAAFTWGLRAINAPASTATGAGVRVAVLDTGIDLDHPDFAGREIVSRSFVEGEDVDDGHGHGTHVIGTACGSRTPDIGPGYGVAYESEIYAGKVLNNAGAGTDGGILAGIAWAVQNGCAVVSMSLGAPVQPGQPHSVTFERAARRAMNRGTLIIAAAGNESARSDGVIAPVSHPANCPTIMAVGAIDPRHKVADFSCGTLPDSGAVDLVAPGVDVHSSWPMPDRHNTISGTSMATPHVAGVAALDAQAYQGTTWELWARLSQTAERLPLPSTDVGAGLVQAP
ncbi:MAG: S8 family serine peptidase [Actinophytocola sp.]|nr:S8 family serine peptidase [Actinophytocola sp.]